MNKLFIPTDTEAWLKTITLAYQPTRIGSIITQYLLDISKKDKMRPGEIKKSDHVIEYALLSNWSKVWRSASYLIGLLNLWERGIKLRHEWWHFPSDLSQLVRRIIKSHSEDRLSLNLVEENLKTSLHDKLHPPSYLT